MWRLVDVETVSSLDWLLWFVHSTAATEAPIALRPQRSTWNVNYDDVSALLFLHVQRRVMLCREPPEEKKAQTAISSMMA